MTTEPDRELLTEAAGALRNFSIDAIAVQHWLDVPYKDRPELTPWTLRIHPAASRAHELALRIRAHLALPEPAEWVPDCPDSKMDDGSHQDSLEPGGICSWCGQEKS